MNKFGKYVKQLRGSRELTLRALSEDIGISHTYLGKIETGVIPDDLIVIKLSKYFDQDINKMLLLAGYEGDRQDSLDDILSSYSLDENGVNKIMISLAESLSAVSSVIVDSGLSEHLRSLLNNPDQLSDGELRTLTILDKSVNSIVKAESVLSVKSTHKSMQSSNSFN